MLFVSGVVVPVGDFVIDDPDGPGAVRHQVLPAPRRLGLGACRCFGVALGQISRTGNSRRAAVHKTGIRMSDFTRHSSAAPLSARRPG